MIGATRSGNGIDKLRTKIAKLQRGDIFITLDRFGAEGVAALSAATPADTGETANSWYYESGKAKTGYFLSWHNSHIESGAIIAILIDYGHGTRTGGYVPARPYIQAALAPVIDRIEAEVGKAVRSA